MTPVPSYQASSDISRPIKKNGTGHVGFAVSCAVHKDLLSAKNNYVPELNVGPRSKRPKEWEGVTIMIKRFKDACTKDRSTKN